jgi:hypothetical protein
MVDMFEFGAAVSDPMAGGAQRQETQVQPPCTNTNSRAQTQTKTIDMLDFGMAAAASEPTTSSAQHDEVQTSAQPADTSSRPQTQTENNPVEFDLSVRDRAAAAHQQGTQVHGEAATIKERVQAALARTKQNIVPRKSTHSLWYGNTANLLVEVEEPASDAMGDGSSSSEEFDLVLKPPPPPPPPPVRYPPPQKKSRKDEDV